MIDIESIKQVVFTSRELGPIQSWCREQGLACYTEIDQAPPGSLGLLYNGVVNDGAPLIGVEAQKPKTPKMQWILLKEGATRLALPPGMPKTEMYQFPPGSAACLPPAPNEQRFAMAPLIAFLLPDGSAAWAN